jgi:hypothetical protein
MPKVKINWKNHSIELTTVFLGITLVFLLDNWRETRNVHHLEKRYLESFHLNLLSNKELLDSLILNQQHAQKALSELLDLFPAGKFEPDSTFKSINLPLSYAPFFRI